MRFVVMHKMTQAMETEGPPSQDVIDGIGELIGDAARSGAFVAGEGLKPSSHRKHLVYQDGRRTITAGPFDGLQELVAGLTLLRVNSKEEALAWCDRLAAAVGDAEFLLGPVNEPWDLGMMPKPDGAPLRYLLLRYARGEQAQDGLRPDPQRAPRVAALLDEMTQAGVLASAATLDGTKRGARIRYGGGKPVVVDGPFAESKELVAGYAIFDLPSQAEAVEWALRFGEIVKVDEIEIRRVAQP